MTIPRDADAILAAWLKEGPHELPEPTRRAIAVATRTSRESRHAIGMPWRSLRMNPLARVAATAIVAAIAVGGAVYLFAPGGQVGQSPAPTQTTATSSPPPSPTPLASAPSDWTSFTSSRFVYSIDYPSDWVATPATRDWPATGFPEPGGPSVDRFGPTPASTTWAFVSSVPLEAGQVAAERIAELDGDNALACQLSNRHDITMDGVAARQEDAFCFGTDHVVEVVGASGGRFYQLDLFSRDPISDALRATFDRFLATFRFDG